MLSELSTDPPRERVRERIRAGMEMCVGAALRGDMDTMFGPGRIVDAVRGCVEA